MPLGFQCRHPGGMAENSWDRSPGVPSPEGTAENRQLSRPFGTQPSIRPHPALKRRVIFKSPSGTKNGLYAAPVDQILVALDQEVRPTLGSSHSEMRPVPPTAMMLP